MANLTSRQVELRSRVKVVLEVNGMLMARRYWTAPA
jgi:hypothetical protein